MTRSLILYISLVVGPVVILSGLALRVADRDHADGLGVLEAALGREAATALDRIERAIQEAVDLSRQAVATRATGGDAASGAGSGPVVAFASDGKWLGYSPAPIAEEVGSDEDLRFYELSISGGESFEYRAGDPERAVDAYAFYLPRISSPLLAARLRFRVLRAAVGAKRLDLAARLAQRLLAEDPALRSEEGLPLTLLAAEWLRKQGDEAVDYRQTLLDAAPLVSTTVLDHFAQTLAPGDPGLERLVAERHAIKRAVEAHPEILSERSLVVDREAVLTAWPVREGNAAAGAARTRAIVRAALNLPEPGSGELEARMLLEPDGAIDAGRVEAGRLVVDRVLEPLPGGSTRLGVEVRDPIFEERVTRLDGRRAIFRSLVALLGIVTLLGGLAMVLFLARQRQLVALRERLLANVSHELKTPATSIRMLSEMLAEDDCEPSKVRWFCRLVHLESLRLSRIIENVLDYSRVAHGKEAIQKEPVPIHALVRRLAEEFVPRAEEAGVRFETEGLADGPASEDGVSAAEPTVRTDALAVERIVSNLLDNALKYRRADDARIGLSLAVGSDEVQITVRDNGRGISGKDRERVFDPFYRSRYEDYGIQGTGLGLSIARALSRRLGGDIRLESREGEGSEFTLELPTESCERGPGEGSTS